MRGFAGQVALVTGGTSGIGEAVVRGFAAEGAKVAILSNAPQADLDAAIASGTVAAAQHVDIADADAVVRAVATPLTAGLRTAEGEAAIAALMENHPSPRRQFFMDPAQIADLILYLASPRSSAIHGAVIAADEGLTATM